MLLQYPSIPLEKGTFKLFNLCRVIAINNRKTLQYFFQEDILYLHYYLDEINYKNNTP